ncbi:hypothetical protein GCM10009115_19180 [Sphingopyxis soli]|uniref:Uncharacterized protein n=1 Tax=Sphingopyxis soli TaxID=592051 RepID=A0ABP3XJ32_9SPHN|nr:hypothetical protein [Sphingopyxis soli]
MIIVSENLRDLRSEIIYLNLNSGGQSYPTEFQTYDEGWESLNQSLAHLRGKLGEARYAQLVEMATQAKVHYDEGYAINDRTAEVIPGFDHIKLGSRLMQDMEQVVKGKPPFAYPEELYRWPR